MKRILSLILLLALLLSSVNALAAAPVISNLRLTDDDHWDPPYDHNVWKRAASFDLNVPANITAAVYDADTGEKFNNVKIHATGEYANNTAVPVGNVGIDWPAVNYQGWHPAEGVTGHYIFYIVASNADGQNTAFVNRSMTFAHTLHKEFVIDPDAPEIPDIAPIAPAKKPIYTHNNIRSFGPRFRDIDPSMTKQWYRFTALDLSQDGKQTFDLISGDHYIVGKVTVTVNGDSVRVDYKYDLKEIWDWKNYKFYTFFSDFDSVTGVEPLEIEKRFEYGKTYSIENDLNGDTSVLLYMANKATHTDDINLLKVFRETWKPYVQQRDAMLDMIEKTLAK